MKPSYLCVMHLRNAGFQHSIFNTLREQEIVLLVYVIINVQRNEVVGVQQYMVNPETPQIRKKLLSEKFVQKNPIREMLRNRCKSLGSAIDQFHKYLESTFNIDPSTLSLRFVTHGQLPLRHHMYPEAHSKNIKLPQYYAFFNDLIKEFKVCYGAPQNIGIPIESMLKVLEISPYRGSEYCVKEVGNVVNITQALISDGHGFENPDSINLCLMPRIYKSCEQVEDESVVKILGIHRSCSEQDVANFFIGLNLAEGGVALCLSSRGRRNGRALVRFENRDHCALAMKRHKHCFANTHIGVRKASGEDFINVAGGNNKDANTFLSKGVGVIIKMINLPYSCTAKDVVTLFEEEENSFKVMLNEEGVFFVKNSDGNATGIALVLFAREKDAGKALRKKSELFGSRHIQLFRLTSAEAQQVLKLAENTKTN